ncbi:MAG: UbiA family prenyltransferase [Chitinispirillales bacterium]|jgi:4-hydroxybenzoate polyprenyltransferase|nr:UbiA family prenyltransferase [Chitinispirillales bacterium]
MFIIKKILDTVFLLRVPLLVPVWTVLILGWITGSPQARVGELAGSKTLWISILGFSLLVASIYVVNQIQDVESDRINGKLFILPQKHVSIPAAWTLAALCTAAGLAIAYTQSIWMFAVFLCGFIVGVLYNLPPAVLKNRAVGGVSANIAGHGIITFLVGWLAAKSGQNMSADLFYGGLLSSIAPGFANGAVFLASTIPDAPGDSQAGKKTFCVTYGARVTAFTATLLCAAALGFSFFMENHFWVMALPSALSLGIFIKFAVTIKREAAFHSFKWPVVLLSTFVTLFVPVYGLLIIFILVASRMYYKWRFNITYPTFSAK